MALTSQSMTVGTHLWVAFNGVALSDASGKIVNAGDSTAYTAAGINCKPANDDTAWVYLGVCRNYKRDPGVGTAIEIFAPSPGRLRRTKVLRPKAAPKAMTQIVEVGPIGVQLLLHTLALTTASTTYNPDAGGVSALAWLKTQQYGQDDTLRNYWDEWSDIAITSAVTFDPEKETEIEFEILPIYNPLNIGSL